MGKFIKSLFSLLLFEHDAKKSTDFLDKIMW